MFAVCKHALSLHSPFKLFLFATNTEVVQMKARKRKVFVDVICD